MKKIELLAPAGSWESLEATVKAGADAVYLAGQQFGARKSAQNFTNEELLEAINYCHLRGVRVFLTVNTLLHDQELEALEPFLTPLYEGGMDAFIVQDLGVFNILRQLYPNIELHCSTQMALHQISDVKIMKDLGASRVVLPREMYVDQIKEVHEAVDIDLEAFVHGALCVSVSGQCLMSSMIGGRSGNRGSCAQSCRQKYKLISEGSEKVIASKDGDYLISPKDLMTIDQLEKLMDSGIVSLKIEGRMKGPEYAYAVTHAYRQAIDAILKGKQSQAASSNETLSGEKATDELTTLEDSKEKMRRIFNRDFTEGFILGATNKTFISQETPGNRGIILGEALSFDKNNLEVQLLLKETINKGDDLQVRVKGSVNGGRVEYIRKDGKRIETASAGETVIVNFKHDVYKGTPFYRTYDQVLMKQTQMIINDSEKTTLVDMELVMEIGKPLKLKMTHENGIVIETTSEQSVEKALKTPLSEERIIEQLTKMGGTPFHCGQITIKHQGDETVPIKALNQLRRDGVDHLTEALIATWQRELEEDEHTEDLENEYTIDLENEEEFIDLDSSNEGVGGDEQRENLQLTAMVRTHDQFKAAAELGVKIMYINNLFESPLGETLQWQEDWVALFEVYPDVEVIPYLGRFEWEEAYQNKVKTLAQYPSLQKVLISSIGQIESVKEKGLEPLADFSLNCFNHETAKLLAKVGANHQTLSLELNDEQIEKLIDQSQRESVQFEIIGYGKIPVMVNQYCPINGVFSESKEGCQICRKGNYYLEDKTGAKFLVKGDAHCQVEIFNSAVLNLADEWHAIETLGIQYYRLNFVDENYDEVTEVVESHIKSALGMTLELRGKGYTKGHFKRGVQ